MDASDLTADEAILECLSIIGRCGEATGEGRFADGYRAAAADMRARIESHFGGRPVAAWERDLRDLETEARTLSRVVRLLRHEQARTSSAPVRAAIAEIIRAIDEAEPESSVSVRDVG